MPPSPAPQAGAFPQAVLALSALTFAGFGLAFTLLPARMAGFVDIALPSGVARTDFRATYGGFELGLAAFLVWCLADATRVRAGLVASACALAGFAVVRLGGILLDDAARPLMLVLLLAEVAGTALCAFALRRAP